ncbi:MAG: hypothetical protein H0V64_14295 [Geodermatophilaceae bacterium]|nr:hypothetical protein [Geodermatophilaceae bacterium]MDQ3464796.1 hypothetical protein [Actinomycetota bacterium]
MSGQLSLFSVEDDAPAVADVEGLLLGGGALVRRTEAVRISAVVDCGWRAESLRVALGDRGLGGELGTPVDGRCSVRSAFDPRLLDTARRWTSGAVVRVPAGFRLSPARLRLWAMAGGYADHAGYQLRLGATDEQLWEAAGAALAAVGIPGAFLGARAGGPAYRIVGARRLARLRELVGRPPQDFNDGDWPS